MSAVNVQRAKWFAFGGGTYTVLGWMTGWGWVVVPGVVGFVVLVWFTFIGRGWLACAHVDVRCVHGDEINRADGARVCCRSCGRYLPTRPLPYLCAYTGAPHWGAA